VGLNGRGFAVAKRVVTLLISDLSGYEIANGKGETIGLSYREANYSIDLTEKEAKGFDKAIAVYLEHAAKVGGGPKKSATVKKGHKATDVRAWARGQGLEISDRGRVPREILEKYRSAN